MRVKKRKISMSLIKSFVFKFWSWVCSWICERQKRLGLENMLQDELKKIQEVLKNASNSIIASPDPLMGKIGLSENNWSIYDQNRPNLYLIQDQKRKIFIKCYNETIDNYNRVYNVQNKNFETFEQGWIDSGLSCGDIRKYEQNGVRNEMSTFEKVRKLGRLLKNKADIKEVIEENLKLISRSLEELSNA